MPILYTYLSESNIPIQCIIVYKLRYKGNLLNIDSSYKGLSSLLLRNNNKLNLQFTKLNSKTRIGSFGIKGWVSGN